MYAPLLFLGWIATCSNAFQLRVFTISKPSKVSIITVVDSFDELKQYGLQRAYVNIEYESDNTIEVDVNILDSRGVKTFAHAKGTSLQEACEKSCKRAIKCIKYQRNLTTTYRNIII